MFNIQDFFKNTTKPIIFGGAIGTELQRRGVETKLPLWSAKANFTDQKILQEIYEDYLKAGINMTITNTFRTTEFTIKKSTKKLPFTAFDLTENAIKILNKAIKNVIPIQPVFIGGCIAPLEDCYEPENTPSIEVLKKEHTKNIQQLLKAGYIDFIIAETMNSSIEAKIICDIAKENNIPFVVSFVNKGTKLLNGESLKSVIIQFQKLGALSILLNCSKPSEITKGLSVFKKYCTIPYGGYGNGIGTAHNDCGWTFESKGNPDSLYIQEVRKWLDLGAKVIGGCCGTTPNTINKLKNMLVE